MEDDCVVWIGRHCRVLLTLHVIDRRRTGEIGSPHAIHNDRIGVLVNQRRIKVVLVCRAYRTLVGNDVVSGVSADRLSNCRS